MKAPTTHTLMLKPLVIQAEAGTPSCCYIMHGISQAMGSRDALAAKHAASAGAPHGVGSAAMRRAFVAGGHQVAL